MKVRCFYLICFLFCVAFYSCAKDEDVLKIERVSFSVGSASVDGLDIKVDFELQTLGSNDSVWIGFMYHNTEKYYERGDPGVKEYLTSVRISGSHSVVLEDITWSTTYYLYPFIKVGNAYNFKDLHIVKSPDIPLIQLIKPDHHEVVGSLRPRFEWEDLKSKGITYQVHLKLDTDQKYKKVAEIDNFPVYAPLQDLLQDRVYLWKVVAVDTSEKILTQSFESSFSSSKHVTVLLSDPEQNQLRVTTRPTFSWKISKDVSYADLSYEIQIKVLDKDSKFDVYGKVSSLDIIRKFQQTDNDVISYTIDRTLLPGLSYQYRIVLYIKGVYAGQSSEIVFRTVNQVLLKLPSNDDKAVQVSPTYTWEPASLPSYNFIYQLFVGKSPVLTEGDKIADIAVGTESFSMKEALSSNTRYYWRVRVVPKITLDDKAEIFAESETRSFSTLSPIQTEEVVIKTNINQTSTLFSWKSYNQSEKLSESFFYNLYLSETLEDLPSSLKASHIYKNNYESLDLIPGKNYYYKISLVGPKGDVIADSQIGSFKIPESNIFIIGGPQDQTISKVRFSQGDFYVGLGFQGELSGKVWQEAKIAPAEGEGAILFRITPNLNEMKEKWVLIGAGNERLKILEPIKGGLILGGICDQNSDILGANDFRHRLTNIIGYDIFVGKIINRSVRWIVELDGLKDSRSDISSDFLKQILDLSKRYPTAQAKAEAEAEARAIAEAIGESQFLLRHDNITALAPVENQNAIYVSGKFVKHLASGIQMTTARGLQTGFVAKLSFDERKVVWVYSFAQEYASDISAVQSVAYQEGAGLVCLLNYKGTAKLYPSSSLQPEKTLKTIPETSALILLDGNKNVLNHYKLLESGSMEAYHMVLDGEQNVYISAQFSETIRIRGGTVISARGHQDVLLMKLNIETGKVMWAINLGGSGASTATDLVVDKSGRSVLLSGVYKGAITVFSKTLISKGGQDGFACRVSYDGMLLGIKSWGGLGKDEITTIQPYDDDQVLVGGSFELLSHLGSGQAESLGGKDAFLEIVKL